MSDKNEVQRAKDKIDHTVGLVSCMMGWVYARENHKPADEIFSKIHFGVPELEKSVGNREHFATILLVKKPPTSASSERDIVYWMFVVIIALRYMFDTTSYSGQEYDEIKEYIKLKANSNDGIGFTYRVVGDEIEEFLCPHTPQERRSESRMNSLGTQSNPGAGCMSVIVGALFFGTLLLLW